MKTHKQLSEDDMLNDFILFSSSDELMEWGQVPVQDKPIQDLDNANITVVQHEKINTKTDINKMSSSILMRCVLRVPKNDIRRYFGKMLVNTLNSGDFLLIQDFFHTFLTKRCRFERIIHNLPVEFYMPKQMGGNGPLQFAHFFLGIQTMFPDMALTIHGNRIVTFSHSKLTKIVLDLECQSTKTVHIPYELWIPPEHLLSDIYSANSIEKIVVLMNNINQGTPQNTSASQNWNVGVPLDIKLLEKQLNDEQVLMEQQPSPQQLNAKRKFSEDSCSSNITDTSTSTGITSSSLSRAYLRADSASTVSSATSTGGAPSSSAGSKLSAAATYIPYQYTTLLQEAALLLPVPMHHHTLGQVELVMDENQHIVYIQMCAQLV